MATLIKADPQKVFEAARDAENKARKQKPWLLSVVNLFRDSSEEWEVVANLYEQAGDEFSAKTITRNAAGEAFEKAAEIQKKLGNRTDMAKLLVKAYNAYLIQLPLEAARVLPEAIEHYALTGNLYRAAVHQKALGDLYQKKIVCTDEAMEGKTQAPEWYQKAIDAYEQAAEWYLQAHASQLANSIYLQMGGLAASARNYSLAIQMFESAAKLSMENHILVYSVEGYFFDALICHLPSLDHVAVTNALKKYEKLLNGLNVPKSWWVFSQLAKAIEEKSSEAFTEACFQEDRMSIVTGWRRNVVSETKDKLEGPEDYS